MAGRHIFLTGQPGVGKSTLVKAVLGRMGVSVDLAGFYTVEVRGDPDNERVGFRSISVADPERSARLATLETRCDSDGSGNSRIGPFVVHVEEAVALVEEALKDVGEVSAATPQSTRAQLVVLDEVGAMQLLSAE